MASHHDAALNDLLQKLRVRDIAVQQLKERCELIQEDYEHNFRLAQEQAVELQALRAKSGVQDKQVRQLEARCTALQGKLREADGEVHRQTQSLQSTVESLRAQLLVGQTEHGNLTRKYADLEMQLASHRQELQQQAGRMSREAETIRRESLMESETRLSEKERLLRVREEQTLRDVQNVEHKCVELSSELSRVKELKETSDLRVEELTKTVARKEYIIQAAQEQMNEMKKAHAQQMHKLEVEAQGATVLKEQFDKSAASQLLTSQREIERRAHENELLEQKLAALKHQHELEVRRRTEEKDEIIRGLEDKVRGAQDKLRSAESRCTELEDEVERLRRRIGEGKKMHSTMMVNGSLLEDKLDDLQRALTTREAEVLRLKSETDRIAGIADRKEKEANELRAEFERRAWQDRVSDEMQLEKKRMDWREHGASKLHHHDGNNVGGSSHLSAVVGNNGASQSHNDVSSFQQPSPIAPPQFLSASQLNLSAIANEVKQQIMQQQQQQQPASMAAHNATGGGTAFLHELSLLREQHHLEKMQLERRLQEASRSARRQRNRIALLEAEDENDAQPDGDGGDGGRRVVDGEISDTPQRHPHRHPHRVGSKAAEHSPRGLSVSSPGGVHLNDSRDGSTAMSIQNGDEDNTARAGSRGKMPPRVPHHHRSAGGTPGSRGGSATSRVEELQRQLAASPVGRAVAADH